MENAFEELGFVQERQRAMPGRVGRTYREFIAKDGKTRVTLRAARWEDLDDMVEFVNGLVAEHEGDINFGTLISRSVTKTEESEWLAKKLARIEQGKEINVAAEVNGRMVANSEVTIGSLEDLSKHGELGIAITKDYRGLGIGKEMMKELIHQSKQAGLKTIQLEVLATNPRAASLYEALGFERAGILKGKVRRRDKVIDSIIMINNLEGGGGE